MQLRAKQFVRFRQREGPYSRADPKTPHQRACACAMGANLKDPPCGRVRLSAGRGPATEVELEMEFGACFERVLDAQGGRWRALIMNCKPVCVWIALTTTIPMLRDDVAASLHSAPVAILAVAKVFLAHLRDTWFCLGNALLTPTHTCVTRELESRRAGLPC